MLSTPELEARAIDALNRLESLFDRPWSQQGALDSQEADLVDVTYLMPGAPDPPVLVRGNVSRHIIGGAPFYIMSLPDPIEGGVIDVNTYSQLSDTGRYDAKQYRAALIPVIHGARLIRERHESGVRIPTGDPEEPYRQVALAEYVTLFAAKKQLPQAAGA